MIGLGKYKAHIENMFFNGDAVFILRDDGGKYGVGIEVENAPMEVPPIDITDAVEDGNTLTCKASTPMMPGKVVDISLTFEGDTCNGWLKVPFVGKIKIKDAIKIG